MASEEHTGHHSKQNRSIRDAWQCQFDGQNRRTKGRPVLGARSMPPIIATTTSFLRKAERKTATCYFCHKEHLSVDCSEVKDLNTWREKSLQSTICFQCLSWNTSQKIVHPTASAKNMEADIIKRCALGNMGPGCRWKMTHQKSQRQPQL